jgi:predicted outer membrane repeat protein
VITVCQHLRGRGFVSTVAACLLAVGAIFNPPPVRADAVVTVCNDAAALVKGGTNLRAALLAPVNPGTLINTITFNCPGGSVMTVTSILEVSEATRIDGTTTGGDAVTLKATSDYQLFQQAPAAKFLYLQNLVISQPTHSAACTAPVPPICYSVVAGHDVVQFHHVIVKDAYYPVGMANGSLTIDQNSEFDNDSGEVIRVDPGPVALSISHTQFLDGGGVAVYGAVSLAIDHAQFTNMGFVGLISVPGTPCTLNVERSSFTGGVAGALITNCNASIGHSIFTNNTSHSFGGAVAIYGGASQVTVRADKFLGNQVAANPSLGGFEIFGGGAIGWYVPTGTPTAHLKILYSTFTGNTALQGGAVQVRVEQPKSSYMTMDVGVSSFGHNSAALEGGAIYATATGLEAARVVFNDNKATGPGGAVRLNNPMPIRSVLANTLFARNTAGSGSAFYGDAAAFVNSTVASNIGLAIATVAPARAAEKVSLSNTIVSRNSGGGCGSSKILQDDHNNLQFPAADCGASIPVADPHLDDLFIPLPKSPPMGRGNLAVCMAAPISGKDVYGVARPSGGVCAIGAAEGDIEVLGGTLTQYLKAQRKGDQASQPSFTDRLVALLRAAGFTDSAVKKRAAP